MHPILPAALALAAALPAGPARAGGDVQSFGVLRHIGGILGCLVLETDDGAIYALADLGGLSEGDRVFVSGTLGGFALCGSLFVDQLDDEIERAFAGTGRLVSVQGLGHALEADGGGLYKLNETGDLPLGSDIYVRGIAREAIDFRTGRTEVVIDEPVIGPAFQAFGRLQPFGGGWTIETELGAFQIEHQGVAFAAAGDYVFVEGWLDPAPITPPLVRDNTTRPAHELAGELVGADLGQLTFQADGLLFDDVFQVPDPGGFAIGERIFVRGRSLSDYDPLEPRVAGAIRLATVDEEFSGCGVIEAKRGAGVQLAATSGETFVLEYAGGFALGEFVHVAGAIGPGSPPRFAHNKIAPCFELSGELQQGFHCTPVFVTDSPAGPAGNVLLLENLGGYWIGDWFCAMGAITACEEDCPFPCMVANTVSDCTK